MCSMMSFTFFTPFNISILFQMHGYPDALPPGCRLPPPPPHHPHPPPHHPDLMYHHPDLLMAGGPIPPPPSDLDHAVSNGGGLPDEWGPSPPSGGPPTAGDVGMFGRGNADATSVVTTATNEFSSYLDTSDDSGRHTGPDPSSP